MALTSILQQVDSKNYIINGAFDFFQRSGTVSVPINNQNSGYIAADRLVIQYNGAVASRTAIRSTETPDNDVLYSLKMSGSNNTTGGNFQVKHRIEGANCKEIVGKRVSYSFWVRNEAVTHISTTLRYADSLNNFGSTSAITDAEWTVTPGISWSQYKIENILLPAGAVNGLELYISFDGDNSLIWGDGTTIYDIYLAKIMLHEGVEISDKFVRAGETEDEEFRMCERFFQKSYDRDVAPATNANYNGVCAQYYHNDSRFFPLTRFRTRMYSSGSYTLYHPDGTIGSIQQYNGGISNSVDLTDGNFTSFQTGIQGGDYRTRTGGDTLTSGVTYVFHWTAESELT